MLFCAVVMSPVAFALERDRPLVLAAVGAVAAFRPRGQPISVGAE